MLGPNLGVYITPFEAITLNRQEAWRGVLCSKAITVMSTADGATSTRSSHMEMSAETYEGGVDRVAVVGLLVLGIPGIPGEI